MHLRLGALARASARTAAAAQELDDPEGEQEGAILFVGPGIRRSSFLVGGDLSWSHREGTELSLSSESEHGGGDDDTKVGAADAAGEDGGDDTSDSFLGANAGADHVESDQHNDDGVGEESD